jgi:iron complex transport system permease protein
MVLLLAGVSLNYTIGAGVLLLQYFADYTETARMVRWMMGDLEVGSYRLLALVVLGSLPGWFLLARSGRALNLMSLGPDEARAQGVDAARQMRHGLLWASWITGLAVSVAGPIGFVGIIVPHAVRLLGGADARVVLPAALLGGGAFLVVCDALSRTLMAPIELPIGILTACLGGPFFLALLLRRRAVS